VTTVSASGSKENRPATENSISAVLQVLAVTDKRFDDEMQDVVNGLSDAFASKLLAQCKKKRSSPRKLAKWQRLIRTMVPTLLTEAFAEDF
jgi:hypothetical protein